MVKSFRFISLNACMHAYYVRVMRSVHPLKLSLTGQKLTDCRSKLLGSKQLNYKSNDGNYLEDAPKKADAPQSVRSINL